jgi:hypothetical protein
VDNSSSDRVKHLHDYCLVRTPQAQRCRTLESHPHQLGHRLLRVLPASAGKPDRLRHLLAIPTQGDSRDHHPKRLWSLHRLLLRRATPLEPRGSLLLPHWRSLLHVPQILISRRTNRKTSRLLIDWSFVFHKRFTARVLPNTSPPQAQPCIPTLQP